MPRIARLPGNVPGRVPPHRGDAALHRFHLDGRGDQGRRHRGAVHRQAGSARRNGIRLRSSRAARPAELPRYLTGLGPQYQEGSSPTGPCQSHQPVGRSPVLVGVCLGSVTIWCICSVIGVDEANSVHLAGLAPRYPPWRLQTTRGYPGSRYGRERPTRDMARDIRPIIGNLISRQGSHPVSCRTGRSVCRYAHGLARRSASVRICRIAAVARARVYALLCIIFRD